MTRVCRIAVLIVFALCLGAANSAAQNLSLSGTVDDTYGVVPAVPVTLRAQDGSTQTTTTDAEGRYRFNDLKPGTYEVAVAKEGFNTAAQAVVMTTQAQDLNMTLTIAGSWRRWMCSNEVPLLAISSGTRFSAESPATSIWTRRPSITTRPRTS